MYCKYCGHEIADDSVFCAKCGKKVQHDMSNSQEDGFTEDKPIRIQITEPTCVQIVETKRSDWKDATTMQWKKPVAARILQSILAVVGLFFLVYGIVWISIVKNNLSESFSISGCWVSTEDSFGIVSVSCPLDFSYKSSGLSQGYNLVYRENCGLRIHNYNEVKQTVVSKFQLKVLLVFILPALTIILLTLLWAIKITPKKENKSILPRDLANKIEDYTWNGFTSHTYLRFIKDDKYGILDAVSRTVVIPASFELIEWREKNKSYDGILDGVRSTYLLNHDSNKK